MTPEGKLKRKVEDFAKRNGVEFIRLALQPGVARGWPDNLFLIRGGRPLFIEFKAPNGHPSGLQLHRIETLGKLGYDVHICHDYDEARKAIAKAVDAAGIQPPRRKAPDLEAFRRSGA